MHHITNKGITMLEILVVISLLVLLSVVTVPSLVRFRSEQLLNNTASDIVSMINRARSDTVSSLNSTSYGVHFDSNQVVYYVGSVYDPDIVPLANNKITFDSSIIMASDGINLNGGGSNVTFTRLTGETTNYGTITIRLSSDAARQKVITISKAGSASSN